MSECVVLRERVEVDMTSRPVVVESGRDAREWVRLGEGGLRDGRGSQARRPGG